MGWRVACSTLLLCGSSLARPSLLGALQENHHDHHTEDAAPVRAYSFQYQEDGLGRQEQQDKNGLVTGSYNYIGEDGEEHTVNYRAGAGIGFQVLDPEVQQMFESFGQKAAVGSSAEEYEHNAIAAEPYVHEEIDAEPYVHEEILAEPYVHEEIDAESYVHTDITAEPYVHADITAEPYVHADITAEPYVHADITAEPYVHADITAEPYVHTDIIAKPYSEDTEEELPTFGGAPDTLYGAPKEDLPAYGLAPLPYVEAPLSVAAPTMLMDPSYYFQYKNVDSERAEDADSTGAVVGSYSYITPGGEAILVRYRAGADTGFVIDNQEELDAALLRAASEPFVAKVAQPEEQEVKNIRKVKKVKKIKKVIQPTPLSGALPLGGLYSAPAPEVLPSYQEDPLVSAPRMVMDASFNFAVDELDHSFQEEADVSGERTGSYSYITPEGREVVVRYRAGAKTGFVIDNEEELAAAVRAATDAGAKVAAARAAEATAASSAEVVVEAAAPLPFVAATLDHAVLTVPEEGHGVPSAPVITALNTLYGAPSAPEQELLPSYNSPSLPGHVEEEVAPRMVMDASFNFAVDEPDHSFQETADVAGERAGSYSFLTPDGQMLEVRYTAGKNGFVILNPEEVFPQQVV